MCAEPTIFFQAFIHIETFIFPTIIPFGVPLRPYRKTFLISSWECTVLCTPLIGVLWFYYFTCNHIHVYFALRSLKARSFDCVFMYMLPPIKHLERMLHIVGNKLSRKFFKVLQREMLEIILILHFTNPQVSKQEVRWRPESASLHVDSQSLNSWI